MVDIVRGKGRTIAGSITRAANTTAYAAGQMVNGNAITTPIQFTAVGLGSLEFSTIMQAVLIDEANQGTKPDLQLFLFDTAPSIAITDGAAFAPTAADMEKLVAVIAFPVGSFVVANAGAGAAGNCVCDAQALFIQANTSATDQNLYGVLVVRNAYTPVASEKIVIRLKVVD